MNAIRDRHARRDERTKVRICGACQGRGIRKDSRPSQGRVPNLGCYACSGSGLNVSMARAIELER